MFEEEKFETGLFPALPQNFTGTKYFRHTTDYLGHLLGLDESVERHRQVRIGGKAAADAEREAYFGSSCATSSGGGESNVIDFGIGAPVAAAGN